MITLQLGKVDLNDVEESQRVFVLQNQVKSLANQLQIVLNSIDSNDVLVSDSQTLADYISSQQET